MTPVSSNDYLFETLARIETKVDAGFKDHGERLARVETLIEERTYRQQRKDLLSRGTWTTIISGVFVGLWELLKAKLSKGWR